jgi:fatty acid synthase
MPYFQAHIGRLIVDAIPGQLIDPDCMLGGEYAGRLADGTRIMGIANGQALATSFLASARHFWRVPDAWTLAQAATVPIAYCTAYYALCIRGRVRARESVLIHSGAGGVGQAAIAVALSLGCTVYTTV